MKVGIVGLGMMGCSLAHDLSHQVKILQDAKVHSDHLDSHSRHLLYSDHYPKGLLEGLEAFEVWGHDSNHVHAQKALELGLFAGVAELEVLLEGCQVVFLAIPPYAICNLMDTLAHAKALIIDIASTKKSIATALPHALKSHFALTHPMCGNEKSGPQGLERHLYLGKTVIFCDFEVLDQDHQMCVHFLFDVLRMHKIYMGALEHDRHVAIISHMPHVVSFALAQSVLKQENPKSIIDLRGGGFESMTRLAKSSPTLWSEVFRDNQEALLVALQDYDHELQRLKHLIKTGQWDSVQGFIAQCNDLQKMF